MTVGERIKKLRERRGISQTDLSRAANISKQNLYKYENNIITNIPSDKIEIISKILKVSPAYLMGWEVEAEPPSNIIPLPNIKKVPLIGTIACGEPILATENIQDYIDIKDVSDADFALRCKGDSMVEARIYDGDIVYIRQQPDVENGEIAAVLIDNEATLKRVYKYPDKNLLILKAANSKYADFVYTDNELENIKIIGKAVAFLSNIK